MIKTILIVSSMISPNTQIYTSTGTAKFVNHSYQMVTTKPKVTPKDIDRYIHNASLKYHVDEKLVRAVIKTESTYRTKAVSKKGAVGLMQLMPATAERFGVSDRTNVKENIYGGVRFLRFLLDTFDGNKKLALAGYNAGENAVIRHHRKIPNYPETINYITLVLTEYKKG